MTPAQKEQIRLVRSRVLAMRDGGAEEMFIKADLRREGWPEAAIQAAMEESGKERTCFSGF